jgi:hypothetical protein
MTEQLLHGADVVAALEQVRRKAVAKGVTGCRLYDPGGSDRRGDLPLDRALENVMAPPRTSTRVPRGRARRK